MKWQNILLRRVGGKSYVIAATQQVPHANRGLLIKSKGKTNKSIPCHVCHTFLPSWCKLSHYSSSLRPGSNGFIPVEHDLLAIILANIHSTIMQKVRYIYPLSEVPILEVFTLKQKKICYQFINLSPCSIFGHAINHMTIIKH